MPVPQSDLEIPDCRSQMMNRNSLRNNSIRRAGSFNTTPGIESFPVDDVALRVNSGVKSGDSLLGLGGGGGSMRLSATLAAEREETWRRLPRELVHDEDTEEIFGAAGNVEYGRELEFGCGAELEAARPLAQQPVRMSLMDLLEETDREAGIQGPTYRLDEEEEEEEAAEEVKGRERGGGKGGYSCCACMMRHNSAAYVPCGHTLCRLCSKELQVQRGGCPICSGFILEVLDIF
ncbi:hypothetical protein Nepgr_032779 [Nepenthes gracilis]|uniref:RING-type domain-containing protein n=1 Tax=Nepenthes gracilis TaxID=150966 RepID=A0AAD3TKV8_NEPGR|nr:hypothetical protein Nepgr_032779 [Nepenthes gracilis]